ncbi:MAG: response regulator [Planctomycetes bacterium]|nr:response regulator [Planctomycetota bacterium]
MTQQMPVQKRRTHTMEILLAEDDSGHATLVKSNLRNVGIQNKIRHFEDGQEVLNFLSEKENGGEHIDYENAYMLLLDIRMPKVSGDEVLRQVKNNPRLQLMPVIMLTTTDEPQEVRRCHELGCNDYITKPVDYDEFVEVIRRLGMFLQIVCVPPLEE